MGSSININGLSIEGDGDEVRIRFNGRSGKTSTILEDKIIKGDVNGNIEIKGSNIKIIIEGDVQGNIVGAADIQVQGDVMGNIVGGRVR